MFGRTTITLGIGPHSSLNLSFSVSILFVASDIKMPLASEVLRPLTRGFAPGAWTPLGAPPPDTCYRLALTMYITGSTAPPLLKYYFHHRLLKAICSNCHHH